VYMDLLIIALNAFIGINCIYHVIVKFNRRKRKDEAPTRPADDS
jgi:hypothetical protein